MVIFILRRTELAWSVFVMPMKTEVWSTLALQALLGALVLRILVSNSGSAGKTSSSLTRNASSLISLYWTVCCSYLGRRPPGSRKIVLATLQFQETRKICILLVSNNQYFF